jgi:hypothetical protein
VEAGALPARHAGHEHAQKTGTTHRHRKENHPSEPKPLKPESLASGVQPDTVITDDLAELREQLEQAAPPDLGTGLFLLFAQEPGIGDPDACQWSSGPNPAVPAVDTGLAGSTRRWRSTGTAQRRAACGTLSSPAGLHRAELGGIAIKAALERAALFTANPDDVIIGQVLQGVMRGISI